MAVLQNTSTQPKPQTVLTEEEKYNSEEVDTEFAPKCAEQSTTTTTQKQQSETPKKQAASKRSHPIEPSSTSMLLLFFSPKNITNF